MAVALRLMRLGKRHRPFYRIIVKNKRSKRDGAYLENIGTYDPLVTPAKIDIKQERLDYWLGKGAQVSEGLRRLLKNLKKD